MYTFVCSCNIKERIYVHSNNIKFISCSTDLKLCAKLERSSYSNYFYDDVLINHNSYYSIIVYFRLDAFHYNDTKYIFKQCVK